MTPQIVPSVNLSSITAQIYVQIDRRTFKPSVYPVDVMGSKTLEMAAGSRPEQ